MSLLLGGLAALLYVRQANDDAYNELVLCKAIKKMHKLEQKEKMIEVKMNGIEQHNNMLFGVQMFAISMV